MAEAKNSTSTKTKDKFYDKPIFWAIALLLLIVIVASVNSHPNDNKQVADSSTYTPAVTANTTEQEQATPEPAQPTETVSQKNAVKQAKSYLDFSGFSRDGLVAQLEYEKFSNADAIYGADNAGADWYVEAEQAAKSYMEFSSFSRQGLIDQLVYDKFAPEQAAHGADSVGL